MEALKIFGIKRMEIHDGDGLRTTIFFKGCQLKCIWCHNPEGLHFNNDIAHFDSLCIKCQSCVNVCPSKAILGGERIFIDRDACDFCGKCADVCPTNAAVIFGKEYTTEELFGIVMQDEVFFKNGGGVTFSGGECLFQGEGVIKLAKKFYENGISVYVDTSGYVNRKVVEEIMPYVDKFLYDIKAIDEKVHIRCTGKSNKIILQNFEFLVKCGAKIEIRYPLVKGYNDKEAEKIGQFISGIDKSVKVKVLKFHDMAASRYTALGFENTMPDSKTTEEDVRYAVSCLKKYVQVIQS